MTKVEIIKAVVMSGGGEVKSLATELGISSQAIIAACKDVTGRRFKLGKYIYAVDYLAPVGSSFSKACPGIANAKNGVSGRSNAEVLVREFLAK